MITLKFDVYKFYTDGYLLSITPKHIYNKGREIINNTTWIGEYPKFADWAHLPKIGEQEEYNFSEHVREKFSYEYAPLEVRYLADELIKDQYFEPLRYSLVKRQYARDRYMRSIRAASYSLWNGQEELPWHCDNHTPSDFFVIMYFTDSEHWDPEWKGQIKFGKEDYQGNIELLEEHYPHDGTFAVVDSSNPLYRHCVEGVYGTHNRYALSFRYNLI